MHLLLSSYGVLHFSDLIDEIVKEPLGGAHRDPEALMANMKTAINTKIKQLQAMPVDELVKRRQKRLLDYGAFEG